MDNEYKVMVNSGKREQKAKKVETIDKKLNDRGNSFLSLWLLLIHEKNDCEPREDVKCHENIYMSEIWIKHATNKNVNGFFT